ncbi:AAA family ATPase [Sulfurimonas sp. HSL1-6]|uniref:bifunctional aminoglycoside phosphotransferase/ATP-binding protein n=1 Tax=Thiomicrolovo immobilis TaxID=3131935 RepID=UPI0031F8FF51
MTERDHDRLVRNLLQTLGQPESSLIQTHISSVIIAKDVVYKLKKPVDFGFLDYSTLERRKRFCQEEVRINGRYAPLLYLGVVAVTGSIEAPELDGEGPAIEYAVKMRRFDAGAQLDNIASERGLTDEECDAVADTAAAMHDGASVVDSESDYGTPARVIMPMQENFDLMASLHRDGDLAADVAALEQWTRAEHARLTPLLQQRRDEGLVREVHGDMHLHNMALFEGRPMLFDAIEFNPYLNHIDVISDLAFLLMDLEYRGLARQSRRILNRYLEHTGDYAAVALLPFYKTYRAMVRAKVLALHAAQEIAEEERESVVEEVRSYIALAKSYGEKGEPFLMIMHGVSASGKSTLALEAVEAFGALRLRSDIERMRLFRSEGEEVDIYTAEATTATYGRLETLAETVLKAGCSAVADATFLSQEQREPFAVLAARLGVPYAILDIECGEEELLRRIRLRGEKGDDVSEADEAVLAMQQSRVKPLLQSEQAFRFVLQCDAPLPVKALTAFIGAQKS